MRGIRAGDDGRQHRTRHARREDGHDQLSLRDHGEAQRLVRTRPTGGDVEPTLARAEVQHSLCTSWTAGWNQLKFNSSV
jgi:hypothetical protein